MTKALLAIALIILVVAAALALRTAEGGSQSTIKVVAEGRTSASPDLAKLTVSLSAVSDSAASANTLVQNAEVAFTKILDDYALPSSALAVASFSSFPEYQFSKTGREFSGWKVTKVFNLEFRELDRLSEFTSALTSIDRLEISAFFADISHKDTLSLRAQDLALANAREAAQGLAKSAGKTLGAVIAVEEVNSRIYRPEPTFAPQSFVSSDSSAIFNLGKIELAKTLAVTFSLAD